MDKSDQLVFSRSKHMYENFISAIDGGKCKDLRRGSDRDIVLHLTIEKEKLKCPRDS
jgi:hypothetical protein